MKHSLSSRLTRLAVAVSVACAAPLSGVAQAADEVNVAYFLEWPTPNQIAQIEKTFDKELGVKVNWKSFGSGNDMSAAMAGGDVDISYSQGLVPFIVAVSKGLPIKTVGIAVEYAGADNCIVSDKNPLDRGSRSSIAASLKGKKVATPVGNVTHYKLLKTLDHFGLSGDDVTIVPVSGGNDAAAAFLTGQVDIGCAFGGPLDKMAEQGQPIMTGAEQVKAGILTFDVISVTNEFAEKHSDLLVKFLQVTEDANESFAANKAPHWKTLMEASGMDEAGVKRYLGDNASFSFPDKSAQLSADWMGGGVQKLSQGIADFYVEQGVIPKALPSYDSTVDASYLRKVR